MRMRLAGWAAVGVLGALFGAAPAMAGLANAGIESAPGANPIAGVRWEPYEGPADPLWSAYARSGGRRQRLLGRLALKPRAFFTGSWTSSSRIAGVAREVVQDTQQGDTRVMAQFGTF